MTRIIALLAVVGLLAGCPGNTSREAFVTFGQAYDIVATASIAMAIDCRNRAQNVSEDMVCQQELTTRDLRLAEVIPLATTYKNALLNPDLVEGDPATRALAALAALRDLTYNYLAADDRAALGVL